MDVNYGTHEYLRVDGYSNILLESRKGLTAARQASLDAFLAPLLTALAVKNPSYKFIVGPPLAFVKYDCRVVHEGFTLGSVVHTEGYRKGVYTNLFALKSGSVARVKGQTTTKDLAVALRKAEKCFTPLTPAQIMGSVMSTMAVTLRKKEREAQTVAIDALWRARDKIRCVLSGIPDAETGAVANVLDTVAATEKAHAVVAARYGRTVRRYVADLPVDFQTKLAVLRVAADGQYVLGDGYRLNACGFYVEASLQL